MADSGVDGVWLQAVLYKLAPFHWEPKFSAHYEERLKNLAALTARASQHGKKCLRSPIVGVDTQAQDDGGTCNG